VVLADDSKSARKSSFGPIAEIATPDDRTVVFTLSQRSISFLYNLSYVWIVNTEAGDLTKTEDGTGPYTLDEWKQGSTLT
ncbi:ABC transporter substrate-binding protein, partial [Microbacterium thalli]